MASTRLGICSARSGLGWSKVVLKKMEEMRRDTEEKKRRGVLIDRWRGMGWHDLTNEGVG